MVPRWAVKNSRARGVEAVRGITVTEYRPSDDATGETVLSSTNNNDIESTGHQVFASMLTPVLLESHSVDL